MSYRHTGPDFNPERRGLLRASTVAAGLSVLTPLFSVPLFGAEVCLPPIPKSHAPSNGGSCPFPIPWLDKNGNHNQMPKENVELSNIFHFQGKLGRCAGFTGMGTDNKGNRMAFGNPTTDFSYISGEYWAARRPQQGAFSHI